MRSFRSGGGFSTRGTFKTRDRFRSSRLVDSSILTLFMSERVTNEDCLSLLFSGRRDRTEHTRKRKLVSHVFSQKNVLSFTSYIHTSIDLLVAQWDRILASSSSPKPTTTTTTIAEFDTLPWFNFLAFDIIGSLAFGRPFGMLRTGKDAAPVEAGGTVEAIRVLNERGEVSATLGCLEGWVR